LKLVFRLFHPMHVPRFGRKQQRCENFLHNGADGRKRQPGRAAAVGLPDGSMVPIRDVQKGNPD
jgi:hypothetical protein